MNFHLKCVSDMRIADTETPVGVYLQLRDSFAETALLEHAERFHTDGGFSYIGCDPMAGIRVLNDKMERSFPDGSRDATTITPDVDVVKEVDEFIKRFSTDCHQEFLSMNGFFGYFSYDTIKHAQAIDISGSATDKRPIPDVQFSFYRYLIVFDHFRNQITILHFYLDEAGCTGTEPIGKLLKQKHIPSYPFSTVSEEQSEISDEEFLKIIQQGKQHCYRGDVFQIVLSREFEVSFSGDEFNVYRALRSINPSPYLFFFDYGNFRLFGSSPEVQLRIKAGKATVHPIAGTYRRSGDASKDEELAKALQEDKKENAEHVMLVDLARNDLSKNYATVDVPVFKTIHQFSHVLHMVSEVTGAHPVGDAGPVRIWADTFPAGTLSGAPKHRAMQLIDQYENSNRGFYGGSVGYIGCDGDFHQAIMIRSFLSKNNKLYYRAGAGVVAVSVPESELAEVNNKVAALRKAITLANTSKK